MICNKLEYKCVEKGYHSMKRNLVVLLLFLFFIVVMSMRDFSIYEEEGGKISSEDFAEQAMLVYEKFLEGKIECDGIDIDFITTPKGEPDNMLFLIAMAMERRNFMCSQQDIITYSSIKMVLCSYIKIYHLIRITML
jgi:hypothetical protein